MEGRHDSYTVFKEVLEYQGILCFMIGSEKANIETSALRNFISLQNFVDIWLSMRIILADKNFRFSLGFH